MKSVQKWRAWRRKAKVSSLRLDIAQLESALGRLSPDYDHDTIIRVRDQLVAKRRELADLTTNSGGPA